MCYMNFMIAKPKIVLNLKLYVNNWLIATDFIPQDLFPNPYSIVYGVKHTNKSYSESLVLL